MVMLERTNDDDDDDDDDGGGCSNDDITSQLREMRTNRENPGCVGYRVDGRRVE